MTRTAYPFTTSYDFDIKSNPKIYHYDISWSDTPESPRYSTKQNIEWNKDKSAVEYTSDYPRNSKKTKWIFLASPLEGDAHMQGSDGDDKMQLNNGFDKFREYPTWDFRPTNTHFANGASGDDTIIGGYANNILRGQAGDDLIVSRGNGVNYLSGGMGSDHLVGSEWKSAPGSHDIFAFDEITFQTPKGSKPDKSNLELNQSESAKVSSSFGLGRSDLISNFASADGDKIGIKLSAFSARGIRFKSVSTTSELESAVKSKNNFVYDQRTGFLYFNQNGASAGFGAGGIFAKLEGNPAINADDLIVLSEYPT